MSNEPTVTDEQILSFRSALSVERNADVSDHTAQLIDYCNRALGAPIYEGQTWSAGPAPITKYKRCAASRSIVAAAIITRED